MDEVRRYVIAGGDPATRHEIICQLGREGYMANENVTPYVMGLMLKENPRTPLEEIARGILSTQVDWETTIPSCVDTLVMDESYIDKVAELPDHMKHLPMKEGYIPSYDCVFFLEGGDPCKTYAAKAMYHALGVPVMDIRHDIETYDPVIPSNDISERMGMRREARG